jgi:hypothetical protein
LCCHYTTGVVSFDACPNVVIASVDNTATTSRITFVNNVTASLLNVSNGGSVSLIGGSFTWHVVGVAQARLTSFDT